MLTTVLLLPKCRFETLNRFALMAAIIVYGLFSSPAPQAITIAEISIAVLLLLAFGAISCFSIGTFAAARNRLQIWQLSGILAFAWFATVPLLLGIASGWETLDIVRDFLPAMFLFLPLFLANKNWKPETVVATAMAAAGVCMAARWWIDSGILPWQIGGSEIKEGEQYLLNSMAVVFAVSWLPLKTMEIVKEKLTAATLLKATAMALLWAVCFLPLLLAAHRAAIAMAIVVYIVGAIGFMRKRPLFSIMVILCGMGIVLFYHEAFLKMLTKLAEKTLLVGDNARFDEVSAVINGLGLSLQNTFLGRGWGALISNPAVGQWWVSYTHSFPSYVLFKTGFIGVMLLGSYMLLLLARWGKLFIRDRTTAVAIIPPLLIGLFLHTSFKYLCFGLLLVMLSGKNEQEDLS